MKILRQSLRQQRSAIQPRDREELAKTLAFQVKRGAKVQYKHKISLYLENDGEINPKYVQKWLESQGIYPYLPVLVGKSLKFARIGNKFKKNRFGIDEPDTPTLLNASQMNIIFIPLVGFDNNKDRIGMGGGFYDRTLSFKKHQIQHSNPKLIGLAFDCQKVDKIITQEWDVPLDKVITPTTIYR